MASSTPRLIPVNVQPQLQIPLSSLLSLGEKAIGLSKSARSNIHHCQTLAAQIKNVTDDIRESTKGAIWESELVNVFVPLTQALEDSVQLLQKHSTPSPRKSPFGRQHASDQQEFKHLQTRLNDSLAGIKMCLLSMLRARQQDLHHPSSSDKPSYELPPKPQVFFGRKAEVDTLVTALLPEHAVHLAILGPGGIGKTTLATTVLHDPRLAHRFSQSDRIFVSCDGLDSVEALSARMAQVMHLPGADHQQAVVRYLTHRDASVLLVLDNLDSVWDTNDQPEVEQFLAELANITKLSFIVTMRGTVRPSGVDWTFPVLDPLRPISLEAARQIFATISHHPESNEEIDDLLKLMDGLPLAITLMANRAQVSSIDQLSRDYETMRTSLLERSRNRRVTSLEVSIGVSLNSQTMRETPEAAKLLSVWCLLPDGLKTSMLKEALPSSDARGAARTLLAVALASREGERMKVLAPIREFIMDHHPPTDPWLMELRAHYRHMTPAVDKIGSRESLSVIQDLGEEFVNINSVLLHQWSEPPPEEAMQAALFSTLQLSTFSYLATIGDCTRLLRTAIKALGAVGRTVDVAHCKLLLGSLLAIQNRWVESTVVLQEAGAAYTLACDRSGATKCTQSIGDNLRMLSRNDEAIEHLEDAKEEFEGMQDPLGAAQCSRSIGAALRAQHRNAEALEMLVHAKLLFETLSDQRGIAQCARIIGGALQDAERYQEAIAELETASDLFGAVGDQRGVMQCKQSIGVVLHSINKLEDARLMLEEAKSGFQRIGDSLAVAQCDHTIGDALHMLGQSKEASIRLRIAKSEYDAIGERVGAAHCMASLGNVLCQLEQFDEGLETLRSARLILETAGDPVGVADCDRLTGEVLFMLDEYEPALNQLRQAATEYEAFGKTKGIAQCRRGIGDVLCTLHRCDEALKDLTWSKGVFSSLGLPLEKAQCSRSIASVMISLNRYNEAATQLQDASADFGKLGDQYGLAQCNQLMGSVQRMLGNHEIAITMYENAHGVYAAVSDHLGIAECLRGMGETLRLLGRYEDSLDKLEAAASNHEAARDRLGTARCTQTICSVYCELRRYDDALEKAHEAGDIFKTIGYRLGVAQCKQLVGNILRLQDRYDEAKTELRQSRAQFEEAQDKLGVAECGRLLGSVAMFQDRPEEAEQYWSEALKEYQEMERLGGIEWCERAIARLRLETQSTP